MKFIKKFNEAVTQTSIDLLDKALSKFDINSLDDILTQFKETIDVDDYAIWLMFNAKFSNKNFIRKFGEKLLIHFLAKSKNIDINDIKDKDINKLKSPTFHYSNTTIEDILNNGFLYWRISIVTNTNSKESIKELISNINYSDEYHAIGKQTTGMCFEIDIIRIEDYKKLSFQS